MTVPIRERLKAAADDGYTKLTELEPGEAGRLVAARVGGVLIVLAEGQISNELAGALNYIELVEDD